MSLGKITKEVLRKVIPPIALGTVSGILMCFLPRQIAIVFTGLFCGVMIAITWWNLNRSRHHACQTYELLEETKKIHAMAIGDRIEDIKDAP